MPISCPVSLRVALFHLIGHEATHEPDPGGAAARHGFPPVKRTHTNLQTFLPHEAKQLAPGDNFLEHCETF